jgi:hypothetical protein
VTFDEIVTGVLQQGGFSVTTAEAGGWVNEVHKRAVAESQYVKREYSIGNTVVDQAAYDLPAVVIDLAKLYLAAENTGRWERVSIDDMWELRAGRASLSGSGGVFAPKFKTDDTPQVELYPPPETAGIAIMVLAAVAPVTMTTGMSPVIPEDMHGDLLDGAIALGLLRRDERSDAAAAFEAKVERMIAKLTRRKNSRIGSGPSRIRVVGYD